MRGYNVYYKDYPKEIDIFYGGTLFFLQSTEVLSVTDIYLRIYLQITPGFKNM